MRITRGASKRGGAKPRFCEKNSYGSTSIWSCGCNLRVCREGGHPFCSGVLVLFGAFWCVLVGGCPVRVAPLPGFAKALCRHAGDWRSCENLSIR